MTAVGPQTPQPDALGVRAIYLHCPRCGVLDRYFYESLDGEWTCQSCRWRSSRKDFKQPEISDEWIAQALGTEISVVQKKDLHGRISCGWFSESKILIAEGQAYARSSEKSPVMAGLLKLAEEEAARRNIAQGEKNE